MLCLKLHFYILIYCRPGLSLLVICDISITMKILLLQVTSSDLATKALLEQYKRGNIFSNISGSRG